MNVHDIPMHNLKEEILLIPIEEGRNHQFRGTHSHNFYEILYFTHAKDNSIHHIDLPHIP